MVNRAARLCSFYSDKKAAQREVIHRLESNGAHDLTIQYAKDAMVESRPTGALQTSIQPRQLWFVSTYNPRISQAVLAAIKEMHYHRGKLRESFGQPMQIRCSFRVSKSNFFTAARRSQMRAGR